MINITGRAKLWFIISIIIIIVGMGALFINGLNLGIDFIGGTIIQIDLHKTFENSEIRQITDSFDAEADITYAGDDRHQVVISTKKEVSETQRKQIFNSFKEKYELEDTDLLSIDKVNPTIGKELKKQSIIAALIAVACMLIYITIRFEFVFGIAAIVALIHDLLIVIGVYAFFDIQVNTPFIAAILTILGYSINDSIVVFDRIRENRKKFKKYDFANLVNTSISQTIRRSLNTSITTLLAITALYILGVQSVKDFALPMIVGFISGTYSSIFIASALWFVVKERTNKSKTV